MNLEGFSSAHFFPDVFLFTKGRNFSWDALRIFCLFFEVLRGTHPHSYRVLKGEKGKGVTWRIILGLVSG